MKVIWKLNYFYILFCLFLCSGLILGIGFLDGARAEQIDTSVVITICGNSLVELGEECDDGNIIPGDGCNANCLIERAEGGGGAIPFQTPEETIYYTRLILEGRVYPNTEVNILKDGMFLTQTGADSDGSFEIEIDNLNSGNYNFGFWANDIYGKKSITFNVGVYIAPGVTTRVSGILIPPTINVSKNEIVAGEGLEIFGQTMPESLVRVVVYCKDEGRDFLRDYSTADLSGRWSYFFNKTSEDGLYELKVQSISENGLLSIFSEKAYLKIKKEIAPEPPEKEEPLVPESTCSGPDLNDDNRVNIVDFSILLYWWERENQRVDLNDDGIINLIDFSVLLYCWTG